MKQLKWTYSGDVNMLDYGGKNIRCIGRRQFQVVELINMDEACGRDNAGQSKYMVELRLVDLAAMSPRNLKSALECCGMEKEEGLSDEALAECCDSYGTRAPLGSWNGGNARKLLRQAYREANRLLDSAALEEAMDKSVNRIGSSAREFMAGDFTSALQRGCEAGNSEAWLMAKIYGIPQPAICDARPEDWLPFFFGYMAGLNGETKELEPGTVQEYFRGFERGEAVKAGRCPAPGWITQQSAAS